MKVYFPNGIVRFQEALHRRTRRLLDNLDCGAVRGNILDVDSQGFSKPQSRRSEEREQHTILFLLGVRQDARDYLSGERRSALPLDVDHRRVYELAVPLSWMQLFTLLIERRGH